MNQLDFCFQDSANLSTDEGFREWLDSSYGRNVANEFYIRAMKLRAKGFKSFGAKAIIESMRFDYALKFGVKAADGFKINNNVVSRLARWAMDCNPKLKGFFAVRQLKEKPS